MAFPAWIWVVGARPSPMTAQIATSSIGLRSKSNVTLLSPVRSERLNRDPNARTCSCKSAGMLATVFRDVTEFTEGLLLRSITRPSSLPQSLRHLFATVLSFRKDSLPPRFIVQNSSYDNMSSNRLLFFFTSVARTKVSTRSTKPNVWLLETRIPR